MANNKVKKGNNKVKKDSKFSFGYLIIYIVLIIWAISTIFPFVWVVNNSFKTSRDVINSSFTLPKKPTLDNYKNAFESQNVLRSYKNSIVISGSVTIAVMLLSTMMAFAMTRYEFRGKKIIEMLIAASLMFPVFATIIPVFRLMSDVPILTLFNGKEAYSLINNPLSVILPQVAGNLSFAALIMMGFLRGLPLEMEEAAYMEGAGVTKVFTKIIIPLSRPSLATVAIFCFLWSYNDLFTQNIMIRDRLKFPICNLLKEISSKYGTDYGLMAASVTLIVIPVLIIYMFLQKNIIKGLTAGAIKG